MKQLFLIKKNEQVENQFKVWRRNLFESKIGYQDIIKLGQKKPKKLVLSEDHKKLYLIYEKSIDIYLLSLGILKKKEKKPVN